MKNHLVITIPDHGSFPTLYSQGLHSWKTYDSRKKQTLLFYPPGAVVVLYYKYRVYREACVIRHSQTEDGVTQGVILPGLSKKVTLLFSVRASAFDKLKRAVFWLDKHSQGAFSHSDGFYSRLVYILEQRGKINYTALSVLAENSSANNQISLF